MNIRISKKLTQTAFILWSIFLSIALFYPKMPGVKSEIIGIDKIIHFALFFIFGFLLLAIQNPEKKKMKLFILVAVLLPFITEIIQIPIPGREFCFYDAFADMLGCFCALLLSPNRKV
jgi:VanZ family protein